MDNEQQDWQEQGGGEQSTEGGPAGVEPEDAEAGAGAGADDDADGEETVSDS